MSLIEKEVSRSHRLLDAAEPCEHCAEPLSQVRERLQALKAKGALSAREKIYFLMAAGALATALLVSLLASTLSAMTLFAIAIALVLLGGLQHSLRIKLAIQPLRQANDELESCVGAAARKQPRRDQDAMKP